MNEPSEINNSDTNLSKSKDTQLIKAEDAKSDKAKDTQLVTATDSNPGKSKDKLKEDKASNTDDKSQMMSTIDKGLKTVSDLSTTASKIAQAVAKIKSQREKTKMKELEIRGNIIVSIQTMVGQFATQIDKMKDIQNDTITKTAAEFTTIVKEASASCAPDKTEPVIEKRLSLHPHYNRKKNRLDTLAGKVDILEETGFDTPESKEEIKRLRGEIKELEIETLDIYVKISAEINERFFAYKEKMDRSEKAFSELISGLVQEGSKDIREVISLQKQIVQLFNNYMELSFNVKPSTQTKATNEDSSKDKDKASVKALLGGAGSYKPAAIEHSPNAAANANSVANVNHAPKP